MMFGSRRYDTPHPDSPEAIAERNRKVREATERIRHGRVSHVDMGMADWWKTMLDLRQDLNDVRAHLGLDGREGE